MVGGAFPILTTCLHCVAKNIKDIILTSDLRYVGHFFLQKFSVSNTPTCLHLEESMLGQLVADG